MPSVSHTLGLLMSGQRVSSLGGLGFRVSSPVASGWNGLQPRSLGFLLSLVVQQSERHPRSQGPPPFWEPSPKQRSRVTGP